MSEPTVSELAKAKHRLWRCVFEFNANQDELEDYLGDPSLVLMVKQLYERATMAFDDGFNEMLSKEASHE